MQDTLALAASIAAMDHRALTRLAMARSIVAPASVNDPLGFALELLRPDSIAKALQPLHRDDLRALLAAADSEGGEDRGTLRKLADAGLVGIDAQAGGFVALPEVTRIVAGLDLSSSEAGDKQPSALPDTSSWFAPAITSVRRTAELLRAAAWRPVPVGRKGQPTSLAVRKLAEHVHADAAVVEHLLAVMKHAGLVTETLGYDSHAQLSVTAHAHDWLALDYPKRWLELAAATIAVLDEPLLRGVGETGGSLALAMTRVPLNYPLLPDPQLEQLGQLVHTAEDLGLTVVGQLTPVALALLDGDTSRALELARHAMPDPVPGVYVQPDLSVIVPGPLLPSDEAALSAIATTEQLGPAASMRLSPASLTRAVRAGLSPDTIRQLLERLSLTGIPQPLDYMLDDLVRVSAGGEHALSAQHTHATGHESATAPAAGPGTPSEAARGALSEMLAAMVDRVHTAAHQTEGDGDLTRRLELAIRDKHQVQVTAVAGADERVFTLLPVSLQGGRLRATDQRAGVERTIPVSAIVAVDAA